MCATCEASRRRKRESGWRYEYDRLGDYFLQSLHDLVFTTLNATRQPFKADSPSWSTDRQRRLSHSTSPSSGGGFRGIEIPFRLPPLRSAFHSETTREPVCILDLKVNIASPSPPPRGAFQIKVQSRQKLSSCLGEGRPVGRHGFQFQR